MVFSGVLPQFLKDARLMKELGINTYRLPISWSRILPEGTGKVNEAGIDYNNFVINTLIKNDIKPLVTLIFPSILRTFII